MKELINDKGIEYDIVQILSALLNIEDKFCPRFIKSCTDCPLGRLGVFQTCTCDEIKKLKTRLILVYNLLVGTL
nr:hypothetical protein YSBCXYJI_YSBCXYJI_CDS_0074 [Caudoviricetes sp.]